jgi:hypothetical protein
MPIVVARSPRAKPLNYKVKFEVVAGACFGAIQEVSCASATPVQALDSPRQNSMARLRCVAMGIRSRQTTCASTRALAAGAVGSVVASVRQHSEIGDGGRFESVFMRKRMTHSGASSYLCS